MDKFVSILKKPDYVYGATEQTSLRFEEDVQSKCPINYEYKIENGVGKVIVHPSESPVRYLKFRFSMEMNDIDKILGDQWERAGLNAYIEWRSVMAGRNLPWYCFALSGNKTACYGVKTGANCFAFFQIDTHGVTLFMNLCNGNEGTDLKESIVACEVVELFAENENVYKTAQRFSKMLCDNPVLPKEPVYGFNNWYWAYGDISYESVIEETQSLMKYAKGCKHRPYMIIDDGWQKLRIAARGNYIGGPWEPNERFNDMKKLCDEIHQMGAKAGIWFRPLLTREDAPKEAILAQESGGDILDPSHPFTLKKVEEDARKIRSWGFDLIKHDFTTIDITGYPCLTGEKHDFEMVDPEKGRKFYDKTLTTAMILKNLYKAVQKGAGEADVISCNVVGHLSAGIHSIHRIGNDTSGMAWEWSRRDGVNSLMRLPQNNLFYNADPDCAAFTEKVKNYINFDYLEMCALTGMTTLASVTPNLLNEEEQKRLSEIFKMADEDKSRFELKDFTTNANPEIFVSPDGSVEKVYDWTKCYNGARAALQWIE